MKKYDDLDEQTKKFLNKAMEIYTNIEDKKIYLGRILYDLDKVILSLMYLVL